MLDQISRKFQELLLVYVLINIWYIKIQQNPTNVKNLRVLDLVSKMAFTIINQFHMKIRLVVAQLIHLTQENLEDLPVETQPYLKIALLQ
jgi:hypothetical protein